MSELRLNKTRLAYSNMKAPADKRDTWAGGIIQVMITRACDLSCVGCTQGSNLAGKPMIMSPEQFADAVISLKDYKGVLGVFGGNPTMHPRFDMICKILRAYRPKELCGLWSNNLRGYGAICRETFNPEYSNLNVHCDIQAYMEMLRDWPECHPKGLQDSRHSPPFVAMKDMIDMKRDEMWELINHCDINQNWSAMVGVFRGELRGWFCELAGAQSMLHEHEKDYPDTGFSIRVSNNTINTKWWQHSIDMYTNQIMKHCFECGIPLRGRGDLAVAGKNEQISRSHKLIYVPKKSGREVQLITERSQLGGEVEIATNYIENGVL